VLLVLRWEWAFIFAWGTKTSGGLTLATSVEIGLGRCVVAVKANAETAFEVIESIAATRAYGVLNQFIIIVTTAVIFCGTVSKAAETCRNCFFIFEHFLN
jgi:hypothetical protein